MEYCFDPKFGFIHFDKLIDNSYHTICKFSAVDNSMNLISEHCLNRALQNPLSIIDIWNIKHPGSHLFGEISGFNEWTEKRLSIIQTLTDESFLILGKSNPIIIKEESSSRKVIAEKSQLKAALVNTNSFEALKINIDIAENYYNELDRENLLQISRYGIFEFTTLFRQLHENPSISSRFVDLLNISECICRYIIGIIHGLWQHNNNTEHQIVFDTKTIAYGSCVDFLRRYSNQKDISNHIDSKIHTLLELKYNDIENIQAITTYLKMLNPNNKVSRSPNFIELHSWLVEIRNKTRGHGTPSKVDFNFYIALEKVVLFMIAKFNNLDLKLVYKSDIGGDQWTFNMSMGGFPGIVPDINKIEPNIHFNPFTSKDLVNSIIKTHNEIKDKIIGNNPHPYFVFQTNHDNSWIPCDSFFKIIQGVVYILNGRQNEKESWISFSTGKIVRPSKI